MAGNVTTLLNTITLPEFSDLVRKQFELFNEKVQPTAAQLFINESLTSHTDKTKRYDEIDVETFAKLKREGENAKKARAGVGYNKTMEAKRVAREIDITYEMRRYGQQYRVKTALTDLNSFVSHRAELDLNHRFTFCSSTSYTDMDGETVDTTVGDGLALASTVHTLSQSSTTYSNRVSGDPVFSQGGLEAAESLFVTDIYSNFGEIRTMSANTVVTGRDPVTVRAVKQVLQSTSDVDAAHAGVMNTFQGKYNHVQLPYLDTTATGARDSTKKRWWFLVSVGMWQAYYGTFEATNMKEPASGNNGEDMHNDNWTYGTRGSYGIVVVSAKGCVCSLPNS